MVGKNLTVWSVAQFKVGQSELTDKTPGLTDNFAIP